MSETKAKPQDADKDTKAGTGRAAAAARSDAPTALEAQLGKHVTIDLTQRLAELDRPSAQAYAASNARLPNQPVYALVCKGGAPPRLDALAVVDRVRGVPLVQLLDWGVVPWREDGRGAPAQRRHALLFERPADPLVAAKPESPLAAMREDQLVERVVQPLVRVLRELDGRGLVHRAISVNNLFAAEAGGSPVTLGECVSAPAGMLQPPVYETIDAAQASPSGRRGADPSDDLYALGVLMAVLLRGGDPSVGVDPKELVARKIERGSYATLVGRARVSLKLMEPMRGLLCDRVEERWDLAQLENWLGGRHQSPKQPSLPQKARRAFAFQGREYWTCPGLAHALANDWTGALRTLANGELEQWVARSLTDDKQAKALQATLAAAHADPGAGDDVALARVLIGLDPTGPIRLRDFAARIDALGQALAVDWDDPQRRTAFVAVLRHKLPQRWLEAQARPRRDHPQAIHQFERMAWLAEREQPGYGLERVLYEFNPGWPCQSELFAGGTVGQIADLLPALEARAQRDIPERAPVDRHVAAFCGAKLGSGLERVLQGLGDRRPAQQALATVTLLAELQRQHGPEQLPALTEWTARQLGPLTDSLHNTETKARLQRRIERATQGGSLPDLRAAVADKEMHRADAHGFAAAKTQYAANAKEMVWLEDGGLTSDRHIAWSTRNVATALSAVCAGILVVLMTVIYVG